MAFKLRSGNKSSFKSMGSSPARQKYDLSKATVDGKHPQTEINKKYKDVDSGDLFLQGKTRDKDGNVKDIQWAPNPSNDPELLKGMESSPTKQASTEIKKFYVDNYEKNKDKPGFQEAMDKAFGGETKMEGKTSITTKTTPAKQAKTKGLGPRTAFGGVKNPELTKTKKPFSTKVMKDGPKKQVTGIDLGKDPHWQPHQFTSPNKQIELALLRKRKGLGPREIKGEDDQSYEAAVTRKEMGMTKEYPYYYKINGQNVSKEAYIKYKNKPGGDEPGKQTNNPTVSLAAESANKRGSNAKTYVGKGPKTN